MLPGFTQQNALIIASLAVAVVAAFFLCGIVGLRRDKLPLLLRDPVALGAFAACAAIVAGVLVGRILIGGWTPFWYYRLLAGYQAIVLAAASTVVFAKRDKPVQAVLVIAAIVLVFGLVKQTRSLHRANAARVCSTKKTTNAPIIRIAAAVSEANNCHIDSHQAATRNRRSGLTARRAK